MPPRIAYAYLSLVDLVGVDGVIAAQGRASKKIKTPIDIFVVCPDRDGEDHGVRFVRMHTFPIASVGRWQKRLFKYSLFGQLDAFRSYDVVVMRYVPALDLAPLSLFDNARARLATVHHAKEAEEIRANGTSMGMRIREQVERFQSPRVLSRVDGIVGVTNEIREYQLAKVPPGKRSETVSNGIDVERTTQTGFVPIDPNGGPIEMIFIASAHAPWHGVDRVVSGLEAYRGSRKIVVHMVGSTKADAREIAGGRVVLNYHGVLRGPRLDELFRRCTLAFSTLAFFRSGLVQACVLKTREYMARGIPFVYGYDDVDLDDDLPFALRVPTSDAPIDIDRVLEFAASVSARPNLSDQMRATAHARLDWTIKLDQLARFATTLA